MKIAVAGDNGKVAQHFGHCEGFNIFTVESGEITDGGFVANPGHKPGFLPNFLNDIGVNVIIAGGMGAGAIEIFEDKNIQVVTGACGDVNTVALQYADGKIESNKAACRQHEHEGSCGGN